MTNNLYLIGRLIENPVSEKEKVKITLSVVRNFKNADGEYETDYIPCSIHGYMANSVLEYCEKGDLVGIRGRVQRVGNDYTANGFPILEIIAERVTFLSNKKEGE